MRRSLAAILVTVVVGWLVGAASTPGEAARRRPLFLYVHDNSTPNQVFGYGVANTGALTPLAGSPFSANNTWANCGGPCETMSFLQARRLLFTGGGSGVSVFQVGTNGALTLVPGSPFGGFVAAGVQALARGARAFVYASEGEQDRICGFEVQADATLVELPGSPFPAGDAPTGMTGLNDLLLAANGGTPQSVSAFKLGLDGTPAAAAGSPFALGSAYFSVYTDPGGQFAYMPRCPGAMIETASINPSTGVLSPLAARSVPLVNICGGLAVTSKPLMFALGFIIAGTNDVQALSRARTGALALVGTPQSSGVSRIDAGALDPKGRFLAVASRSADMVRIFRANARTGRITLKDTETPNFGQDVNAVVFAQP